MNYKQKRKKGQIWFIDFVVGVSIFMIVVVVYYNYFNNVSDDSESMVSEMGVDAKALSSSLISQGYPMNWTQEDVQRLGLTNGDYRLNETKLAQFSNMNYSLAKTKLNTRFEFYFFLEDKNGHRQYYAGLNASEHKYLVQTTRLAILNSTIQKMVLYVWQ